jgi:hypothetical protein
MGNQRHHRVLSTSTCGSDQFNLDIWIYNLCNFIILSMRNKLSWEKHIGRRQQIIRYVIVFILMLINKVYEKFRNHFIENLITTPLGHNPMVPLIAHPPLFLTSIFFSYTQHFATFYVSLYDIYTKKTIKQYTIIACT